MNYKSLFLNLTVILLLYEVVCIHLYIDTYKISGFDRFPSPAVTSCRLSGASSHTRPFKDSSGTAQSSLWHSSVYPSTPHLLVRLPTSTSRLGLGCLIISTVLFKSSYGCSFFGDTGNTVGNGLDAQTAFVTLALLNTMRSAFRLIPSCITAFSQVRCPMPSIYFTAKLDKYYY